MVRRRPAWPESKPPTMTTAPGSLGHGRCHSRHAPLHAPERRRAKRRAGKGILLNFTPANWIWFACRATPTSSRAAQTCPTRRTPCVTKRRRGTERGKIRTPESGHGTDVNASRQQAVHGRHPWKRVAQLLYLMPLRNGYSPALLGAHDDRREAWLDAIRVQWVIVRQAVIL